ncbi:MAG: SOS response-associated peptidase family protein [Pseudolabrys sp.]
MCARSRGPLAFAGLWETWIGSNGEEMETATIVTTRANRPLADIHERMPVIVASDAFNLWLDCANVDAETAAALIAPAPDDLLEAYEVSTAVNRTANDNPKLIERDLTLIGTEAVPERAAALGALSVPRRTTGRGPVLRTGPEPLRH